MPSQQPHPNEDLVADGRRQHGTPGAVPPHLRGVDVEAPNRPVAGAAALPDQDEYEVRVYDVRRGRRLVAF
ncbi:MAG TPA: hypothetical protein VMS17_02430 [Gemmataceae bacterium]|nr:hypothetical protein [Gemmataceae bacterium]